MHKVLLKKNGKIHKINIFSNKKVEISSLKECLSCVIEIEDGTIFKTLFNIILKDKEFFDIVFKDDLHGNKLKDYEIQWRKHSKKSQEFDFIDYLEIGKFFETLYTDSGTILEIFPMFTGIKSKMIEEYDDEEGKMETLEDVKLFAVNLLPINILKNFKVYINNELEIYNQPAEEENSDIEISAFIMGATSITVYDVVKSILLEISCYGSPEEKEKKKKEEIEKFSAENILDVLEARLKETVDGEEYEEAANIKRTIDNLKREQRKQKNPS